MMIELLELAFVFRECRLRQIPIVREADRGHISPNTKLARPSFRWMAGMAHCGSPGPCLGTVARDSAPRQVML
jgi:hypothetical protein